MKPFTFWKALREDVSGATAVEYGLILALVFLAMMGAVDRFGRQVNTTWDTVSSKVVDSTAKARGS